MGITVTGTGRALPALKVDNKELEKLVDTSHEWIVSRTGMENRYVAVEETGVDLAVAAAKKACGWEAGGWSSMAVAPEEIGLVIVATVSPDQLVPSMAALVKKELGLPNAVVFDLNSACSGFVYSAWVAESLMKAGLSGTPTNQIDRALVIGVERLSRIVDWTDRGTCVLFGDGAGAMVLSRIRRPEGILGSFFKNYDDEGGALAVGMDYPRTPFDPQGTAAGAAGGERQLKIRMNGSLTYKFAVHALVEVMREVLDRTGVSADEVAFYVPHQANLRIIKSAAQRMKQPLEKFQMNMSQTGNTSAASVPMVLSELMESGKVKNGDKIMMAGFGGGLSAGAILFEAVSEPQSGLGEKAKVSSGYLRALMNESDRM